MVPERNIIQENVISVNSTIINAFTIFFFLFEGILDSIDMYFVNEILLSISNCRSL